MKVWVLVLLLLLSACSSLNVLEPNHNEKQDYYILLSSLLGINENRNSYIDSNGNAQIDHLKSFKELEAIYIRHIKPDKQYGKFSPKRLKIIMLFAFYAEQRNSAAFNEYLASDLVPIYVNNKDLFLQTISELPFLLAANCNRLNAYFGFEGKNNSGKSKFIASNLDWFEKYLTVEQKQQCLAQFSSKVKI